MLPPKSVWIEAPMLATTFRERTVIPRTTPRLAATRCPSKVKAVVTHWRGMGMVALQSTSCTVLAINSPRELVGDGAPRLILRCTKARLYYPRASCPARSRRQRWPMPWGADAQARGDVDFVPIRYFDTVSVFAAGGAWAPDAVIVHCSPPDRAGYLSLGVSVSYGLVAARRAPCVIAQVNPRMPRTLGNAFLHRSQIDCWAEAEQPLVEYPPTPVGEIERTIARHVAELVAHGATVQVGVGSIPQAVMEALAGKHDLGIHSLLVDHMLPLIESGVITNSRKRLHRGRMDVGEIMGTERLFRWAHDNPMVNMEPSDIVHDPQVVG